MIRCYSASYLEKNSPIFINENFTTIGAPNDNSYGAVYIFKSPIFSEEISRIMSIPSITVYNKADLVLIIGATTGSVAGAVVIASLCFGLARVFSKLKKEISHNDSGSRTKTKERQLDAMEPINL